MLSEGARADTIPFLEIETAEVKCSHAGAVGRVDDEHLFYLQSRGVPRDVGQAADRLRVLPGGARADPRLEELRAELDEAVAEKIR